MRSGAKSYIRKGFLIYEECTNIFTIYEEVVLVSRQRLFATASDWTMTEDCCCLCVCVEVLVRQLDRLLCQTRHIMSGSPV